MSPCLTLEEQQIFSLPAMQMSELPTWLGVRMHSCVLRSGGSAQLPPPLMPLHSGPLARDCSVLPDSLATSPAHFRRRSAHVCVQHAHASPAKGPRLYCLAALHYIHDCITCA